MTKEKDGSGPTDEEVSVACAHALTQDSDEHAAALPVLVAAARTMCQTRAEAMLEGEGALARVVRALTWLAAVSPDPYASGNFIRRDAEETLREVYESVGAATPERPFYSEGNRSPIYENLESLEHHVTTDFEEWMRDHPGDGSVLLADGVHCRHCEKIDGGDQEATRSGGGAESLESGAGGTSDGNDGEEADYLHSSIMDPLEEEPSTAMPVYQTLGERLNLSRRGSTGRSEADRYYAAVRNEVDALLHDAHGEVSILLSMAGLARLHRAVAKADSHAGQGMDGVFRTEVTVGLQLSYKHYRTFAPPEEIPSLVSHVLERATHHPDWHPIQRAYFIYSALVHYIHPFEDGNGRTSRLLGNMVLWSFGFRFLLTNKDKVSTLTTILARIHDCCSTHDSVCALASRHWKVRWDTDGNPLGGSDSSSPLLREHWHSHFLSRAEARASAEAEAH